MLTIPSAAMRLRRELTAAEKTSDDLLLQLTAIQASIITARNDTEVAAHTGQEALLRIQRSMSQAIAAQSDLFRAHDSLVKVGREVMGADEPYCPPSTGISDDAFASPVIEIAA